MRRFRASCFIAIALMSVVVVPTGAEAQATAYAGTGFSITLGTTNAALTCPPCTYKMKDPTQLPVGLNAADGATGIQISGVPKSTGVATLDLYAINSSNQVFHYTLTLTVSPDTIAVEQLGGAAAKLPPGYDGQPYSATIAVFQSVGAQSCQPSLVGTDTLTPANVTLDPTTGVLSSPALKSGGAAIAFSIGCKGGAPAGTVNLSIPAPAAVSPPTGSPANASDIEELFAGESTGLSFEARPLAGQSTVTVSVQNSGDKISIWEFDPGVGIGDSTCSKLQPMGSPLQIVTLNAPSTTSITMQVSSNPTVLNLPQPLVADEALCLMETPTAGQPIWSGAPLVVANPNDYGLFSAYFTLGAQATNQISSSGSSTVGQYLEVGFNTAYLIAHGAAPGVSTNVDVRLNPIPVAAPTTTTSSATGTISSIAPNELSVQQSVTVQGSLYFPWRTSKWNNNADAFTLGPAGDAGFGTLLNPTSTSTSGSQAAGGATNPTQITTTNFASGIYFWAAGGRAAWDRFSSDKDEAPQMITEVVATIGDFSNLPSYVCKLTTLTTDPYAGKNVTTACDQGPYAPQSSTSTSSNGVTTIMYSNVYWYYRTVRPRIDLSGIAKLPGYPFIVGIDANLQQYKIGARHDLDYLNKPGNDVRVYVGVNVDLATLISKL